MSPQSGPGCHLSKALFCRKKPKIDPPTCGGVVVLEPTVAHLSFGDGQSERRFMALCRKKTPLGHPILLTCKCCQTHWHTKWSFFANLYILIGRLLHKVWDLHNRFSRIVGCDVSSHDTKFVSFNSPEIVGRKWKLWCRSSERVLFLQPFRSTHHWNGGMLTLSCRHYWFHIQNATQYFSC